VSSLPASLVSQESRETDPLPKMRLPVLGPPTEKVMEIGNPKKTIIIHPLHEPVGRPKPVEAPAVTPVREPVKVPVRV